MTRVSKWAIGFGVAALLASGAFAAVPARPSSDVAKSETSGPKPGSYDYLILSMAWSPTWCSSPAGHSDHEQCGGTTKFGFIAHGLWPQFPRGSGNSHGCGDESGLTDKAAEKVRAIMPSRKLINNEWQKHGTCFGGDAEAYFGKLKAAWDKVKIPGRFKSPAKDANVTADDVRKAFLEANPGLAADDLAVTCHRQRSRSGGGEPVAEKPVELGDVRVCMDKDLNFHSCGSQVRDRCTGNVLMGGIK